jgi:hypothetical protein
MRLLALAALAALVLAGCASYYEAPPEPEPVAAPSDAFGRLVADWIVTLGASDPEARKYAAEKLVASGPAAGPWLFAGAEDADAERAAACRQALEDMRCREWEQTPPMDEEFARHLKRCVDPGHPLRVFAWWWIARVALQADSRRVVADAAPALRDPDPEVRRYAAILHIRHGHDVRKLVDILPDAFEEALKSPGEFAAWEDVLASLAASTFDDEETAEVRRHLREFLARVESRSAVPWWEVRLFFRKVGPPAEPLLVSILLDEPPGTLRRLAAFSYGFGTAHVKALEERWKSAPDDDLAIALGNTGRPAGARRLVDLLSAGDAGSLARWAAALALERATGKWLGDCEEPESAEVVNERWMAALDGRLAAVPLSLRCADGGAMLVQAEEGWGFHVATGPVSRKTITSVGPDWIVFKSSCGATSTAAAELLADWRLRSDWFDLGALMMLADDKEETQKRMERMVARAACAAAGVQAEPPATAAEAAAAIRAATVAERAADRAALADRASDDDARALALRRLAFGSDEDAAALAAWLDTKPAARLRTSAYLTLWQMDTETSLLALASRAADREATLSFGGGDVPAAAFLLYQRAFGITETALKEEHFDPAKCEETVRQLFRR